MPQVLPACLGPVTTSSTYRKTSRYNNGPSVARVLSISPECSPETVTSYTIQDDRYYLQNEQINRNINTTPYILPVYPAH